MDAPAPITVIGPCDDGAALAALAAHNARMLDLFAFGGMGEPAPHRCATDRPEILRDAARAVTAMADAGIEITMTGYVADAVAAARGIAEAPTPGRRTYGADLVSAYLAELVDGRGRAAAGIDRFAEDAGLSHLAVEERAGEVSA